MLYYLLLGLHILIWEISPGLLYHCFRVSDTSAKILSNQPLAELLKQEKLPTEPQADLLKHEELLVKEEVAYTHQCDLCNYKTNFKGNLKKHKESRHKPSLVIHTQRIRKKRKVDPDFVDTADEEEHWCIMLIWWVLEPGKLSVHVTPVLNVIMYVCQRMLLIVTWKLQGSLIDMSLSSRQANVSLNLSLNEIFIENSLHSRFFWFGEFLHLSIVCIALIILLSWWQGCILFHRFWKPSMPDLKSFPKFLRQNHLFAFHFFLPTTPLFLSFCLFSSFSPFLLFSSFYSFPSFSYLLSSPFEKLPNLFWNHSLPPSRLQNIFQIKYRPGKSRKTPKINFY